MEGFPNEQICKYCALNIKLCYDEGLQCEECKSCVHVRCLKRGLVPGGLNGDLFYKFTCLECSTTGSEIFKRTKLSWLQAIHLALYHLLTKSPGLSRNGFFHWRNHIVTFIDSHWELLFTSEVKRKKKWIGTVAGRLSFYSNYIFLSGAKTSLHKTALWTLMYPKLSPAMVSNLYSVLTMEKQTSKLKNERKLISDAEFFHSIIVKEIKNAELIQTFNVEKILTEEKVHFKPVAKGPRKTKNIASKKRSNILPPNFSQISSKNILKNFQSTASVLNEEPKPEITSVVESATNQIPSSSSQKRPRETVKMLDPCCHFNTSLSSISRLKGQTLYTKLTGGIREELILSPYSGIYLKPFIRRDIESYPDYLKLQTELLIVANKNNPDYVLPPKSCLDFVYVQPELIPAINSLCNQFFWPGIDLTESLQYPEFSCVVLYKRLVVAFAFMVPDVGHIENYISFIFTRPGWRKLGIAKFMVYHLAQVGLGRDITLHVSPTNPALLLYQWFGFKKEKLVKGFYDKYYRSDVRGCKDAFFCRLINR